MGTYTVKSNRSTYHIDGMQTRTKGLGRDTGDRVSYFAESVCGGLTRGWFQDDHQTDDLTDALATQQKLAAIYGKKACRNCTKAAEQILAQMTEQPEADDRDALAAALDKLTGDELELIRRAIADNRI